MQTFWTWLLFETRQPYVPPSVLQSYEKEFKDQLRRLIQRTQHQGLRARLLQMLDCPIRDSRGNCRSFTEYILSALIKNGIHTRYDIEAALQYVIEKMLMDRRESGEPRITMFGGFEERPDYIEGNPLQARLLKYLQFAINNIRRGKIPRLAAVAQRPQGTVSIGLGRRQPGDPGGDVSPDEIADRPSADAGLEELVGDISILLRRKEQATNLPLVAMLHATLNGMRTEEQRRQFGDRKAREGRRVIIQTIKEYAEATGNQALLNMLRRLQSDDPNATSRPRPVRPAKPKLLDRERDYASIVSVIERLGRPVGSADLGRYRRRWLQYAPRDATLGFRNRLEEVLARMVEDGVLRAIRTKQGAVVYGPGSEFERYKQLVEV